MSEDNTNSKPWPRCPDGGRCWNKCDRACFRIISCGPLSGVYPNDEWPVGLTREVKRARRKEEEEEAAEKRVEEEKEEARRNEQELATLLHKSLCRYNHTDGCGWEYESWESPGFARNRYLEKAKQMLEKSDFTTIKTVLGLIED